jgi:hypothetical protein
MPPVGLDLRFGCPESRATRFKEWDVSDAESRELLERLNQMKGVIRDRVKAVASGRKTGLYLCGRAGIAKTTIVCEMLDSCGATHRYENGASTALAIFNKLEEYPEHTLVLDDVGECFNDKHFFPLMLAALGKGGKNNVRVVRYGTGPRVREVRFRGGLIFISNLELGGHSPRVVTALKERINVIHYDPSDKQLEAVVRQIAASRHWGITRCEANDVATFLIQECSDRGVRLSIRLFVEKALNDFRDWKRRETETHWQDLIKSDLVEAAVVDHTRVVPSRRIVAAQLREALTQVWTRYSTSAERIQAFKELVGKGKDCMYATRQAMLNEGNLTVA